MTKTEWRLLGCRKDGERWVYDSELAATDKAALEQIHQQQIARFGKDTVGDLPDLLTKPVLVALVAERNGEIVDGAYGEAIVEWCHVGCDVRASVAMRRFAPVMIALFKKRGLRLLRLFVPRVVEEPVGNELERTGFRCQDKNYAHYLLDLR